MSISILPNTNLTSTVAKQSDNFNSDKDLVKRHQDYLGGGTSASALHMASDQAKISVTNALSYSEQYKAKNKELGEARTYLKSYDDATKFLRTFDVFGIIPEANKFREGLKLEERHVATLERELADLNELRKTELATHKRLKRSIPDAVDSNIRHQAPGTPTSNGYGNTVGYGSAAGYRSGFSF